MAVTYYTSGDSGAPSITTASYANLVSLLDAILVNGYGSKPAAGWTKPYSNDSASVYRNAATSLSRSYFRFASGGTIIGYHDMTDADTGTGAFGNDATRGWGSGAVDIVGWCAIADERTLFLSLFRSSQDIRIGFYIGDPVPLVTPDEGCAVLFATTTSRAPYGNQWLGHPFTWGTELSFERVFALKGKPIYDGAAMVGVLALNPCAPADISVYWYENAGVDGRVYVSPMWFYHATTRYGNQGAIRGRLRWINYVAGNHTNYTDNATVSGMGMLSGKTLRLLKVTHNSGAAGTQHLFLAADLED